MLIPQLRAFAKVMFTWLGYFAVFSPLMAASGLTYYVAPWGNNHNSGSSPQSPWGTIFYAAYQMQAGDTLLVRGGIYSNQGFTIPSGAGTPNAPLRIEAYPGETPVFTGSETYGVVAEIQSSVIIDGLHFENFTNVSDAVDIWGSYVTIQNCTFKNVPYQFIRLMGADHVTIQGNFFDGNGEVQSDGQGDAIYAGSATNVLVQNNYDTRAGHYFFDAMALPQGSPAARIIVRDNTVESFWGGGIAYGSAQNLVFENNRLSHIGEGVTYVKASFEIAGPSSITRYNVATDEAGWYSDNVLDIDAEDNGGPQDAVYNRVYNNVFYNNGYLPIFESQRWERNLTNNKVINNILYSDETGGPTFYDPTTTPYIGIETYHAYPKCPTDAPNCSNYVWTQFPNWNYFQNNIILHADSKGDHPGAAQMTYSGDTANPGWTKGNFSIDVSAADSTYSPFISGNIEKNPEFVSADTGDFSLQPNSPAIAAGLHLAHVAVSGHSSQISVDDPYVFTDGYGLVPGDEIRVGANPPARITAVNTAAGTLSLNQPITVEAGEPVDLADHNGPSPDIGAFEYSPSSPLILPPQATVVNATSATIAWITSSGATGQVEYGTTQTYGQTSIMDSTLDTDHTVTLSGLWPNTKYHYAVISVNSTGGRTVSEDGTFTTPAAPGPVISNVLVSNVSETGATISWTTSTPGNSQVFYSGTDRKYIFNPGYANSSALEDASGVVTHSVAISGLLPNTQYHFAVQSTDLNGDTSFSPDATLITQSAPAPGPVISNISISDSAGPVGWFAGTSGQRFAPSGMNCCGYSYAQATFSWKTNTPTTQNKVLLIPTVGGGYLQSAELDSSTAVTVSGNPEATTDPTITIYQLAPNTTYVYMVQSTDAEGHTSISPNYEFTTPSTAPPTDGSVDPPPNGPPTSGPSSGNSSVVEFIAKNSGKCLDVPGSSTAVGTNLDQASCSGAATQQWNLTSLGNSVYEITSAKNGMCVDVSEQSTANGAKVIQYPYWGGPNEHWKLQKTSDGYFNVISVNSGSCLEVYGGPAATQDGAHIDQWACWAGDNQKWTVKTVQ